MILSLNISEVSRELNVRVSEVSSKQNVRGEEIFETYRVDIRLTKPPTAYLERGDIVVYTGTYFDCLMGVRLAIWEFHEGKVACTFNDPGRPPNPKLGLPANTGITTWLNFEDLEFIESGSPQKGPVIQRTILGSNISTLQSLGGRAIC